MKFCPVCDQVLARTVNGQTVVFTCACGESLLGTADDLHISSQEYYDEEVLTKFQKLIDRAAYDPVNTLVPITCTECNREYQTRLRLGPSATIITICRCGQKKVS